MKTGWRALEHTSHLFSKKAQETHDALAELLPPPTTGGYEALLRWNHEGWRLGLLTYSERSIAADQIGNCT